MTAGKTPKWPTEAALCAGFIDAIDKRSWVVYPETAGWDILLVRKVDGFQIGIQAKLRFNVDVISQAIEDGYVASIASPGPDCRAVLVPESGVQNKLGALCACLGVTVIRMRAVGDFWTESDLRLNGRFSPALPVEKDRHYFGGEDWHELAPPARCTLPDFVPDSIAGAPSPVILSEWKIKALKLSILLEERGFVTRADFSHLELDYRRWTTLCWLKVDAGRFVRDAPPDFKGQHPRVYEQIKALPDWRPSEPAKQEKML